MYNHINQYRLIYKERAIIVEMTKDTLIQHLKHAAQLEASIYRQEESLKQARSLVMRKNVAKGTLSLQPPVEEEVVVPVAPTDKSGAITSTMFFIVCGILSLICSVGMFCIDSSDEMITLGVLFIVLAIISLAFGIGTRSYLIKTSIKEKSEYEIAMKAYVEKKSQVKKRYAQKKKEYDEWATIRRKEIQERYENDCRLADRNYQAAQETVQQLEAPLAQTKELLEKFYQTDWLFPKYRNLVAVCTIYEYFASGRCDELIGSTGAYNLYEAEVRQNLIINQLEIIADKLDQIKANQYMLYTQLEANNRIIGEVSQDIKAIMNSTQEIAYASHITAICAKITAENSEIQKYMTLMNM